MSRNPPGASVMDRIGIIARLLFSYGSIGLMLFYAYAHWHGTAANVSQDPKMQLLQTVVMREMHSKGLDTLVHDQGNMTSQAFDAVSSDPAGMAMRLTDTQVVEEARFEHAVMERADGPACQEMFSNSMPAGSGEKIGRVLMTMSDSQLATFGRLLVAAYRANVTPTPVGHWYAGKDLDNAFERATSKLPSDAQARFRWLRSHAKTLTPPERCEWSRTLYTAAAQLEPADEARLLRGIAMWLRTGPSPFDSVAHRARQ